MCGKKNELIKKYNYYTHSKTGVSGIDCDTCDHVSGDIMMCTIVTTLRLMHEYRVVWWSREGCIVHEVLKHGPLFVCINTIVLIAIERCVAVVLPAKFSAFASPRNVKIQLGLVWLLALVELIFPMAIVKVITQFTVEIPLYNIM